MNRMAGLIGGLGSEADRAARLRSALAASGNEVTVVHPAPGVSIAWCGDADLAGLVEQQDCFVMAYGSAYSILDRSERRVTQDDIHGLATYLLHGLDDLEDTMAGLAGSYLMIARNRRGDTCIGGDVSGNRAPYYAIQGEELVVSSHPLVCARLRGEASINRVCEDFLLIYGFYPDGQTVYRDVLVAGPGRLLKFFGQGWGLTEPVSYQALPGISLDGLAEEQIYDRLYEEMLHCVRDQVEGVEEIGVLLGGFDSALVAAMLHRLGKKVRTYSFRYAEEAYNQPHTDTLSRCLGSQHAWVEITPEVIADGLATYAEQFVQPTNWLNYVIQTVHLCMRMRKDGIQAAYSGDGCDTLFLGYPGTYKRTLAYARLPRLPKSLVTLLAGMLGWKWMDRNIGHPYRVAMGLLRAMARPMPVRAFLTFRVMDEITLNSLRKGVGNVDEEKIELELERIAEPFRGFSIQRLGYAAKSLVSPNRAKLLASTDCAGMRVHSPYLHPRLRAFASMIPDAMLRKEIQSGVRDPGKICLARMAERHGLLPAEVIYQPKLAAIDSPIDSWIAGVLRTQMMASMARLPFQQDWRALDGLLNTTVAEHLYKRYIGSTRVISDAASLLATYGAMSGAVASEGDVA